MQPTRRSTLLGLGALALGSGAAFSSAAFQDAFDADSSFRVVVDQRLRVRAGKAFRDGSPSNDYSEGPDPSWATDDRSDIDFSNPGDISLPAAFVNDETNEDLVIDLATAVNAENDFSGLLQVENLSDQTVDIGAAFVTYGDDATAQDNDESTNDSSSISRSTIRDIYRFEMGDTTPTRVSQAGSDPTHLGDDNTGSDTFDFGDSSDASPFTVGSGETEQITLTVDTQDDASDIIAQASGTGGGGFSGAFGDVDLIDEIRIGTVEDDPTPQPTGTHLEFDDRSGHVEVTDGKLNTIGFNQPFSISTWVEADDPSSAAVVTTQNDNDANAEGVGIYYSDGFLFRMADGEDRIQVEESGDSADDSWNHIVATYDGTEDSDGVTLYVNGTDDGTVSHDDSLSSIDNDGDMYLGARTGDGNIPYEGKLDDVRFYDKALSESEVKDIDDDRDTYPDVASDHLIGWYKLNEDTDPDNVKDFSEEENDGSIKGDGVEWIT